MADDKKLNITTDKLNITIDTSDMTIGDLIKMDKATRGELDTVELIELLDSIIAEDITVMKISVLWDIAEAINQEIGSVGNPPAPEELGGN